MRKFLLTLFALVAFWGGVAPALAVRLDVSGFKPGDRDIDNQRRVRFLGPFLEWRAAADGRTFFALRPFYSRSTDPARERTAQEYLWPVASSKRTGKDSTWRCLTAFSHDFDTADPNGRYRFWFLPFLFWGRDTDGHGYFAAFPFGGTIREFLGQDEVVFALFPIYGSSTVNGRITRTWLWPCISRTRTDKTLRFRFLPFYARVSTPDLESRSYAWPFWHSIEYKHPGKTGHGYLLFPIMGRINREDQSAWMFLPPFFRFSKGKKMNEANFPWPIFRTASKKEDKFFFWPIYGYKHLDNEFSSFYLWPIVTYKRVDNTNRIIRKFKILPLIYNRTETRRHGPAGAATNTVVARDFHLWPLTTYQRDGDRSILRLIDLWPLNNEPVERNWAPFWTIYSHKRVADAVEDDLLWGLFNHARKPGVYRRFTIFPLVSWESSTDDTGSLEWSFLKGLFGRRRVGDSYSYRVLYTFRFGD